jgi:dienelactone hydrolase
MNKRFRIVFAAPLLAGAFIIGIFTVKYYFYRNQNIITIPETFNRTLDKYSIENLSNTHIPTGRLVLKENLKENDKFITSVFEFIFAPNLDNKNLKKTTGMINFPKSKPVGIIVMIRGFVNEDLYQTGMGTKNAANYFAEHGFITVAPDFLGYGGSDKEADDIFESRFQTYVTILSLLKTLEAIPNQPELINAFSDLTTKLKSNLKLFLWAHSNGGQIALSVLEESGVNYPTVLWAPVSKNFPYSILYYTDEADDSGKFLRSKLSEFEKNYDTDLYSLTKYINKINAPIKVDHGTADLEVPEVWSKELVQKLKDNGKSVVYRTFPGADHNMQPFWNDVIMSDLNFYSDMIR